MSWIAPACRSLLLLTACTAGSAASPQEDYVLHCMGCHGPTAEGVPGKVPPLARSLVRFMRSADGRDYLLRVPGAANSTIGDAELAAVLNWVAASFGDVASNGTVREFTAEEVAAKRHVPLPDVLARRRAVIEALRETGPAPATDY